MWSHLGPLVIGVVGLLTAGLLSALAFVVPLVIKETYGKRSEMLRAHAVELLNFAITQILWALGGLLLTLITGGFGLVVVVPLAIWFLVARIRAAVGASRGRQPYRYPATILFVR